MKAYLNVEKDGKIVKIPLYDLDPKFFKGKMLTVSFKNPKHVEYLKKELKDVGKKEKEYDKELKAGTLKESILEYSGELDEACKKKMMSKDTDATAKKHSCKYCGKSFKGKDFKDHVKKCSNEKFNY